MRIYYFGEFITDTNTTKQTKTEEFRKPYKRPQARPIREILDDEPDVTGRPLLAFQGAKKFIIRDFAHA